MNTAGGKEEKYPWARASSANNLSLGINFNKFIARLPALQEG